MGRTFDIVYDDFSGGHYPGGNQARQPANTWTGVGVHYDQRDGTLHDCGEWYRPHAATVLTSASISAVYVPKRVYHNGIDYGFVTCIQDGANTRFYLIPAVNSAPTSLGNGTATPYNAPWAQFNDQIVYGSSAGLNAYRVNFATGAHSSNPVPVEPSLGFRVWKDWIVYARAGHSNLYWSSPQSSSNFPAGNNLPIGHDGEQIIALVPTADTLYILTTGGWWGIEGVLGETETLRRVSPVGFSGFLGLAASGSGFAAAECSGGLVSVGRANGEIARLLSGSVVSPWLAPPLEGLATAVKRNGDQCVVQWLENVSTPDAWIFNEMTRTWRRTQIPGMNGVVNAAAHVAEDLSSLSAEIGCVVRPTLASNTIEFYVTPRDHRGTRSAGNSAVNNTLTVTLAEHHADHRPFKVYELVVEVDFGVNVNNASRTISARVLTNSRADQVTPPQASGQGTAPAAFGSGSISQTWTLSGTLRGDRTVARLRVSDGMETWAARPELTMTGLAVRRVIMRCEEVA